MRAYEFINEELNPDIYHSGFTHELEIDGLRYTAETDNNSGYGNQLIIKVYDGDNEIATAEFLAEPHDQALISMNTWVINPYKGKGISTTMYAYAKMLGNDIIPSDLQTSQGEQMWDSWYRSGQAKHILPKGHKFHRRVYEEINQDILEPDFKHEVEIGDYRYTAKTITSDSGSPLILIQVFDGARQIAFAGFTINGNSLESDMTSVSKHYRQQGIATNMYAYAKMLGNDIVPSSNQLDAGTKMWDAWKKSDQAKHILPKSHSDNQELAEDATDKILYHVTPAENVSNIMQHGLVPGKGARSQFFNEQDDAIYCFGSKMEVEDALMNWLGNEFDDDQQLALLQINATHIPFTQTRHAEYEYTITTTVPPNVIKLLDDNI